MKNLPCQRSMFMDSPKLKIRSLIFIRYIAEYSRVCVFQLIFKLFSFIHFYVFFCLSMQRIRIALSEAAVDVEMRRVRLVAPGKWMLCASFILPKSVAFAKPTLNM